MNRKIIIDSIDVSLPNSKVKETVYILSDEAKQALRIKGKIPPVNRRKSFFEKILYWFRNLIGPVV